MRSSAQLTECSYPLTIFEVPFLHLDDMKSEAENLETIREYKDRLGIPDHVLSIKSLSDYRKHPELNEPTPPTHPSTEMMKSLTSQAQDSGEKTTIHVPEHELWNKNLVLDKIRELRTIINKRFDKTGRIEAIVKALKKAEIETSNEAERKNILKKKPRRGSLSNITEGNILPKTKKRGKASATGGVQDPEPDESMSKKKRIDVGDRVKIKTRAFGSGYAKGKPKFTYGHVKQKKGDLYDVLWDAGDSMVAHKRHLEAHESDSEEDENEEPRYNGRLDKETILPILSVGSQLSQPNPDGKDSWPKDFYEALLRDDWRDWVQAVKNETDSCGMF
jgi:hypothetical protein